MQLAPLPFKTPHRRTLCLPRGFPRSMAARKKWRQQQTQQGRTNKRNEWDLQTQQGRNNRNNHKRNTRISPPSDQVGISYQHFGPLGQATPSSRRRWRYA